MQSGGEAATGNDTNGAVKKTSSVSSTNQSGEAEQQQSLQHTSSSDGIMVKQNGEDYDEGVEERMLKDESTQKIAKDTTEVKIIFLFFVVCQS